MNTKFLSPARSNRQTSTVNNGKVVAGETSRQVARQPITLVIKALVMVGLLVFCVYQVAAQDAGAVALTNAGKLLEAGKPEEAFQLLLPLEDELAGTPDYDYVLGVAAIESERADLAVFALERVLSVEPDNLLAKAELGRAFFLLRENDSARTALSEVRDRAPTPGARAAANRYLDALESRFEDVDNTHFALYVEVGGGYDSNVNSAVNSDQVAIPALGNLNFQLTDDSVEQDDGVVTAQAGFIASRRLTRAVHGFVTGRIQEKLNVSRDFDTATQEVGGGLRALFERNVATLSVQWQRFEVDNDRYRTSESLSGQWQHALTEADNVSVFGQLAQLRFHPTSQSVRDVFSKTVGVAWAHDFSSVAPATVYANVYVGQEDPRENLPQLDQTFFGTRIGGAYGLRSDLDLTASVGYRRSEYDGEEPLFLVRRTDDLFNAALGLEYRPAKQWTIRPIASYATNSSNVPINEYERWSVMGTVRFEYR